jgi:uncharacterized membrane protein
VITIRIPAPSSLLVANLMGLLGLLAVVVAVGLLAGWAWALLTVGVVLVGLSLIATSHAAAAEAQGDARPAEVPRAA